MTEFILGWFLSKNYNKDNISKKEKPKKEIIVYEHWPEFNDDAITLEECYELYDTYNICHVKQNNHIETYYYYKIKEGQAVMSPEKTYDRI